jgi:osmoprotectant transport system substrate-binding protein
MRSLTVVVCATMLVAACTRPSRTIPTAAHDDEVTVGTFNFPESRLLGELYAQALEGAGFDVRRAFDLGPREFVEPALERGLIEVVPEYGGSLLTFLTAEPASADPDSVSNALRATLAPRGLTALDPAPAQDRNVVVVTRDTAARLDLTTLSDLTAVDAGLTLGGPPECPDRPLCLPGLRAIYGLSFTRFVPLDEGGPVTAAALASSQVQAAVMFSSDGSIRANNLVVLRDDRQLQPAENVTPVVRTSALERFGPRLADVLNAVSAALTTSTLRALNEAVSVEHRSTAAVASEWLTRSGLPHDDRPSEVG